MRGLSSIFSQQTLVLITVFKSAVFNSPVCHCELPKLAVMMQSLSIFRPLHKAIPALAILVLFNGCGNSPDEENKNIFRYNELGDVTSLDPAAATNFEINSAVNQLFNGLVEMDVDLNVNPCIAKNWDISTDGLTYTFFLRNDVYFHDNEAFAAGKGRKEVASDFVFSFDRLFDKTISKASTLLDMIDRDEKAGRKGFSASNDTTFVVNLKQAYTPFLGILTMKYFSVVPKEVVEKLGRDFARQPVGTGPFTFKAWKTGVKLLLGRNPNYFKVDADGKRLPYLDGVAISFIHDPESAFLEFTQGRLDMLSGADAINKEQVLERSGKLKASFASRFDLQTQPFLKTDYLGIFVDTTTPTMKGCPLNRLKVRRAINYAIDREKFIRYKRYGIGMPATAGFVPPGMSGYDISKVKGYPYDPDRATKLLAEAGYNGDNKALIKLYVTPSYNDVADFVRSELRNVNIEAQVEIMDPGTFTAAAGNGKLEMFRKSWIGDYPDPDNFMSLFYSKHMSPDGSNYTHYKNPRFDELYEEARSSQNDSLRMALYLQMDEMIINDAPVIPLFYDQIIRLVPKTVSGLETDATNLLYLERVKKN